MQRYLIFQAGKHPVADDEWGPWGGSLECGHQRASDSQAVSVVPVVKNVPEEKGGYWTASGKTFRWWLRLEEVVLQQLDAASHCRILVREEALTLSKHVRHAILHEEGEVWESVRESNSDVPTTATYVDDSAIEGVPWKQVSECARLAIDWLSLLVIASYRFFES